MMKREFYLQKGDIMGSSSQNKGMHNCIEIVPIFSSMSGARSLDRFDEYEENVMEKGTHEKLHEFLHEMQHKYI